MQMATTTVRIPHKLKRRMAPFSDVNWSEVVREALIDCVELEFDRRTKEVEGTKEACAIAGRIDERLLPILWESALE